VSEPEITVHKVGGIVPISCCLLTDYTGVNHCKHEPHVARPVPWRRRIHWAIRSRIRRGRRLLGRWIAGISSDEWEEYH